MKFLLLTGCVLFSSNILHAQLTAFENNGKWGFKNEKGTVVVPAKYAGVGPRGLAKSSDGKVVDVFVDGLAPVTLKGAPTGIVNSIEGGKWGFVDATGKEVTPLKYDEVKDFKDGYAVVVIGGKRGLVGKTGKEVVPPAYDDVQPGLSDGLAVVMRGGRWGYVDASGKEIIPLKFYHAMPFSEGLAAVSPDSPKAAGGYVTYHSYGFIDKRGQIVIPAKYSLSLENGLLKTLAFDEGQAPVRQMGQSFYIDKMGKAVAPSIKHHLFDIYADSYDGFKKTASLTVLEHDAARGADYYAMETPLHPAGTAGVRETVGMSGERKLYFLSFDRTTPAGAAAADAALPALNALMDAAAKQGWSYTSYVKDYGVDKDGNKTIIVTERTSGLPDPRKQKMRLTDGERKLELVIAGR